MSEVPTVKIVNPHNPNDFIIIAESDFKEGEPHTGHGISAMVRWRESQVQSPAPARPDGESPPDYSNAARVGELKLMTIAELGPAISDEGDVEMLVRLLDLETRTSARALIQRRLDYLEAEEE